MLDHLRVRRNNIIHKGYEEKSDTSERILFQLNRYVTQALWLIVSNGLEFSSKELAINYAKKNRIDFELIEPKKRKIVKKSYADNFLS